MRDPKRIPEVLAAVAYAWKQNPQLRLCQLLSNAASHGNPDMFYVEDDELLAGLRPDNTRYGDQMSGPECPKCAAKPLAIYRYGVCVCRACGYDSRKEPPPISWTCLDAAHPTESKPENASTTRSDPQHGYEPHATLQLRCLQGQPRRQRRAHSPATRLQRPPRRMIIWGLTCAIAFVVYAVLYVVGWWLSGE